MFLAVVLRLHLSPVHGLTCENYRPIDAVIHLCKMSWQLLAFALVFSPVACLASRPTELTVAVKSRDKHSDVLHYLRRHKIDTQQLDPELLIISAQCTVFVFYDVFTN